MRDLPLVAVTAFLLAPALPGQTDGDAVRRIEQRMRELDAAARVDLPEDAPISDRLRVDWGGSAQFALYAIDDATSEAHDLRQWDGRAWLSAEFDSAHRFFGRLKFRYDDWNSGDDFDGEGDDLEEPIGERWWYEFAPCDPSSAWTLDAKLGKQYVQWGEGLALSNALIGALVEFGWERLVLELLAADTAPNDIVDFDASRPSFDSNTKRRFLGAQLQWRGAGFTPFVHVLRQIDRNDRDFALFIDGLGQLYPTNFDYDSTYWGLGGRGTLGASTSWHCEFDFETGRALSSPVSAAGAPTTQTREDLRAWAFAGGLTWLLHDEHFSRAEFEAIVGSSDADRLDSADTFGGNLTGTTDRAFNAFGFVNTGLALAPDPSNLVTLRLGGATTPLLGRSSDYDRLRAVVDGFLFVKLDPDAPINVPTTADRLVGGEIDVGIDWDVLSDVALSFRYGLFMPGAAMPSGEDGTRQIVYWSVAYAF